ncbi:hypothetical protein CVU37_04830 [candidate division BRC1 bacterium HGW-BRC1-1]|jgi:hypothetical protein|nr:MAG: hypothetical protein CVU37_04830 [candidate division BRC1 bacterium HGW-BRC1-1]
MRKPSKNKLSPQTSPVKDVSRQIKPDIRLFLSVYAGGRCEFDGCNRFLFKHHVTRKTGNFAELAHIVAFKEKGPRGSDASRPALPDINDIENLMLLCPVCHKHIDDEPDNFSVCTLKKYKKQHECRVFRLTDLDKERGTHVVRFKALIRGEPVMVSRQGVYEAVSPFYPEEHDCEIDLTGMDGDGLPFLENATHTIERKIGQFIEYQSPSRLSVFGLGPIPLLIYLGSTISNKMDDVQFFQFHRDKTWKWKRDGEIVKYDYALRQKGAAGKVALALSISGQTDMETVRAVVGTGRFIYELFPTNVAPSTVLLRRKEDLDNFKTTYERCLAHIVKEHGVIDSIMIFPAVPAPIAICCGHVPLKKAHPALEIYDLDRTKGGFIKTITVNT